jgi:hypothetical protein
MKIKAQRNDHPCKDKQEEEERSNEANGPDRIHAVK